MATTYQPLDVGSARYRSTNFAVFSVIQGTNSPVTALKFDAATDQDAFWRFRVFGYGSGNISVDVDWYADTATSGDVVWGAQIAAITPNTDTQDVETKAFATAATFTDNHLGTTGQREHRATVTVTALDSVATGDEIWLRLYRDADNAADTMLGFAMVTGVTVSYSDT